MLINNVILIMLCSNADKLTTTVTRMCDVPFAALTRARRRMVLATMFINNHSTTSRMTLTMLYSLSNNVIDKRKHCPPLTVTRRLSRHLFCSNRRQNNDQRDQTTILIINQRCDGDNGANADACRRLVS